MESRIIEITPAAAKHGNLYITACGKDFFPSDAFGKSARNKGLGKPINLIAEGLKKSIITDIPSDSKTGRPRKIFRERRWVKDFVKINNLVPGDKVVIAHIENRTYQISAGKKVLTFIDLFAGIGEMRLGFEATDVKCVCSHQVN